MKDVSPPTIKTELRFWTSGDFRKLKTCIRTQPIARCIDISSAGKRVSKGRLKTLIDEVLTHLRVILQGAVVDTRCEAHCYQTPVRKIDSGEWRHVLTLESTDAVDAIADYRKLV